MSSPWDLSRALQYFTHGTNWMIIGVEKDTLSMQTDEMKDVLVETRCWFESKPQLIQSTSPHSPLRIIKGYKSGKKAKNPQNENMSQVFFCSEQINRCY